MFLVLVDDIGVLETRVLALASFSPLPVFIASPVISALAQMWLDMFSPNILLLLYPMPVMSPQLY